MPPLNDQQPIRIGAPKAQSARIGIPAADAAGLNTKLPFFADSKPIRIGQPKDGVTSKVTSSAGDDYGNLSVWEDAYGVVLNAGVGIGSGVEIAGAVANLVYPQLGEGARQAGMTVQDFFKSKMPKEWQDATDRSWLDFSSTGAWATFPRSFLAGIAQNVPFMIGTGGFGSLLKMGVTGVAKVAGRDIAEATARKVGYGAAGSVATAGESAADFEEAADEAGLSPEDRRAGQLTAGAVGAVMGVGVGAGIEHLTGEAVGTGLKALGRRAATGVATETLEEGGGATGTELGKKVAGLDFSWRNIAENAAGGAVVGGPVGIAASHYAASRNKRNQRIKEGLDAEEQAAAARTAAEAARLEAEDFANQQQPKTPLLTGPPPVQAGPQPIKMGADAETLADPAAIAPVDAEILALRKQMERARSIIDGTNEAKSRLNTNQRVKAVALFKRLRAQHDTLMSQREQQAGQPFTDPSVSQSGLDAVELTEVNQAIDKHVDGVQEEPPVDMTSADVAVNRSQRAVAGAVTRRANRAAAATPQVGPGAPPISDNVPFPKPAGGAVAGGNAEKQAIAVRPSRARRNAQPESPGETAALQPPQPAQPPGPPTPGAVQAPPAEAAQAAAPSPDAAPPQGLNTGVSTYNNYHVIPTKSGRLAIIGPSGAAVNIGGDNTVENTPANRARLIEIIKNQDGTHATTPPSVVIATPAMIPQRNPPQLGVNPAPSTVMPTEEEVTSQVTPNPPLNDNTLMPMTERERAERLKIGQEAADTFNASLAAASDAVLGNEVTTGAYGARTTTYDPTVPQQEIPPATGRVKPFTKMTGAERITKMLRAGPQNINDLLAALQDAANTERNSPKFRLIQRLRQALPNSKRNPLRTTVEHRTLSAGFQGIYSVKSDKVYLDVNQAEDLETALLHEAVHAATLVQMRQNNNNNPLYERVQSLAAKAMDDWARKRWTPNPDVIRGFNSPEEFIAAALTNFDFADKLGVQYEGSRVAGKVPPQAQSFFQRLKNVLGHRFTFAGDTLSRTYFDALLDFIPDGKFLQEGNRQEVIAEINRLGINQPVALFTSSMRSMMRQQSVASVLSDQVFNRVWAKVLPTMSMPQIARTYGQTGQSYATNAGTRIPLKYDTVNKLNDLNNRKAGLANKEKALASQVMEYYKAAVQAKGPDPLNNLLYDSRLFDINPDMPPNGSSLPGGPSYSNIRTTARPGGMNAWNDLNARWGQLSQTEQTAFKLVRDSFARIYDRYLNEVMVARMRILTDNASSEQLRQYIDDPSRSINVTHAGINLTWQRTPTAAEVTSLVTSLPISAARQVEVATELNKVTSLMGRGDGPYVPLRRTGKYYMHILSTPTTQTMSRAAYDNLLSRNRVGHNAPGDIEIVNEKRVGNQYEVTYRFTQVQSYDSEWEAKEALTAARADYNTRGLSVASSKAALGVDHTYQALGLQNQGVVALQETLKQTIGGNAGDEAARIASKFYLERLPDTSVRKSQLQAKKIAGASRNMLHVLAHAMQGQAYFQAQMQFGPKISRVISTEMPEDISELHRAHMTNQANDLTELHRHFLARDQAWDRIASNDMHGMAGKFEELWKTAPHVAAAWMLTGTSTAITNMAQVPMVTAPWLNAIHGPVRTTKALTAAYAKLLWPVTKTGVKEFSRAVRQVPSVIANTVRNRPLPTFRNPTVPFFVEAMQNLNDPMAKAVIHQLADAKQIDFGMVADIQGLSEGSGRGRQLFQYTTEAAHIMMQSVETLNRMVTALASYDLNKPGVTLQVTQQNPGASPAAINQMVQDKLVSLITSDIDATQFSYGYESRPLLFQKEVLRAAATFKMYPQNMWYAVTRNMLQAINYKFLNRNGQVDPRARRQAQLFLGGLFVNTMAAAGMMGWLAFDPFYAAALALAHEFGDDDDPETWLRKGMQDWVPQGLQETFLHGVSYGAGGPDTSRMAIPQFFPWQEAWKIYQNPDSNYSDYAGLAGEFLFGAPGSGLADAVYGAKSALVDGNYGDAFIYATPKAFGINDFARAWSMANKGMTDSKGRAFITPDQMGVSDYITRFLGFQPASISQARARRNTKITVDAKINNKRQALLDSFANAQMEKDFDARETALKDIKAFNKANKHYAISRATLISSIQQRKRAAKSVAKYGVQATTKGMRATSRAVDELYGVT